MAARTHAAVGAPPLNQLLAALPATEAEALLRQAVRWRLEPGDRLYEPDTRIDAVWFPESAVISLLCVLRDGSAVETATVGREGMVGLFVFLGDDRSPNGRAVTQMGGEALRVDVDAFRVALGEGGKLHSYLLDATRAMLFHVSQSVACSGAHSVRQRLARWLLQTSDRTASDEIRLTHEFLSDILHARRASVSVAVASLQADGLVDARRGAIVISDRSGLEGRACECYGAVNAQYSRLLPGE